MSRIDPNIALSVKPLPLKSPIESASQAIQLRSAMQQYRLNDIAMSEAERKRSEAAKANKAISTGKTRTEILANLQSSGLGEEYLKVSKQFDEMDQNALENTLKEIDSATKLNDLSGEVANRIAALPGELRPSAWVSARSQWQSQGLPGLEDIPSEYPGDQQLNAIIESTKTGRDRIEMARKAAEEARLKKASDLSNQKTDAELAGTLPTEKERNFRLWLEDKAAEMFNGKTVGELTRQERAKARDEFEKSSSNTTKALQDDTFILKNGEKKVLWFNPDVDHPGYFYKDPATGKLTDYTDQVKDKFRAPPASVVMANLDQESVPAWTELVSTGQAELTDISNQTTRDRVAQAMVKQGLMNVPKPIREGISNIGSARSLIQQVEQLAQKIMDSKDAAQKAQDTIMLRNQTNAIGTLLGRMIGGERGVITDKDRDVAVGLLPGWIGVNFAPKYVKDQLEYLYSRIDSQEAAYKRGYFGKLNTPGTGNNTGEPATTTKTPAAPKDLKSMSNEDLLKGILAP